MHQLTWLSAGNNGYFETYFKKAFTIDQTIGFRPILGTIFYDKYGTHVNTYPVNKRPDVRRILFVGDSVTQNHNIIDGIRKYYGDDSFEYWNAGVGSYNTVQEVHYYLHYNKQLHPDVVILTFVFNDFDITPIAFYNSPNDLVVYSPKKTIHNLSPFLYKYSYLYRFYIGYVMSHITSNNSGIDDAKKSLLELKTALQKDNIKLIVLVSPWLKPTAEWDTYQKNYRLSALKMLDELQISYFDLSNSIDAAAKENITLKDPVENDLIHPSPELGLYFGKYLYEHALLGK